MLDFFGTVTAAALMIFVITTLLVFLDIPRASKLVLAGAVGLWVGLAAATAAAGLLSISRPFPVIAPFVVVPVLAAAIAAVAWPAARGAMLSLPLPLIVGLHIGRVLAFVFLLLAAQGRLAGPFPHSAAWGDIITGVLAIPLIWLALEPERHKAVLYLWNTFGLLDLITAITLGITSTQGSQLQIFYEAPGSAAMQTLPWSFIPTVMVPIWMILHGIVWGRLRQLRSSRLAHA